jgi:C-3',4' desaturase CrtD
VGAGVGGLTVAALLARAGVEVTVLEAHVSPGGCAGTFVHRGYRFDAGATLAGGFAPGGPMARLAQRLGVTWPAAPAQPAMAVHLPDGARVRRWTDLPRWRAERVAHFGAAGEPFWTWQEGAADALWALAARLPPWPAQSPGDALGLLQALAGARPRALGALAGLVPDAFRPIGAHLERASPRLRWCVDGQLLITAQTTSTRANALYGAAALDLPRRGVVHLAGGMGAIAETLAAAVRRHGGAVRYRQEAVRVVSESGRPVAVETRRGATFRARTVVCNVPPGAAAGLLLDGRPAPGPPCPPDGWGAFVCYVGLDDGSLPLGEPLHHLVLVREPFGEGNSVFVSVSPGWDASRAPAGRRALTISTHTAPGPWWDLWAHDRAAYADRVAATTERVLGAAARAVPALRAGARLVLPGTPVTFRRYTRRPAGWVGGYPQTHLWRARGPRLGRRLWLVGDSVFPGQSTAAVTLGAMRVAAALLGERRRRQVGAP